MTVAVMIAFTIVFASVVTVAWRLLRGPSAADRVIATDALGLLGICMAALTAALTGHPGFLDVALGIAIFGFLGAVAFAGLLERKSLRAGDEDA